MTAEGWVGDLGHLALAEASLNAAFVEILKMIEYARYPEAPRDVSGYKKLTTGRAAKQLQKRIDAEPALFGGTGQAWLTEVKLAAEERNVLMHAQGGKPLCVLRIGVNLPPAEDRRESQSLRRCGSGPHDQDPRPLLKGPFSGSACL